MGSFGYFHHFGASVLRPPPTADDYIIWLIFGCGLLFQLPVISIFFTRIGIFPPEFLREYRKFAIVIALILGAVLTPPDPVSQILIVIPLILLYEFSILISKILQPRNPL